MTGTKARILCVDDEPAVLAGLQLHLRRRFEVLTATSPFDALGVLDAGKTFAVVISDMRMPGMNGAELLARVRTVAPDTVRILLTGHADFETAIAAVNEGQIFRFLTKPCPPGVVMSAVESAAEHHRLVRAERELLEETLAGSIRILVDALALANPTAFGRAARLKRTVAALCERLSVKDRWHIEVAAQLSQVGCIALPDALAERVYFGQPLDAAEQAVVARVPKLADQLLAHVPRLEPVREILAHQARRFDGADDPFRRVVGEAIPLGARMLRVAVDLDDLEATGLSKARAAGVLQERAGLYDPRLLEALEGLAGDAAGSEVRELPVAALRPGMILAEDVRGPTGILLVARGFTVSPGLLERLRNQAGIREPIRVELGGA